MELLGRELGETVVVAGVGCAGRGDDGFGPALARALASGLCPGSALSVFDCGDRPEDMTAELIQGNPDAILLVDAVAMGAAPGDAALLEEADLVPRLYGFSHRASLGLLMRYLAHSSGASVYLLAVEPQVLRGPALSPPMEGALDRLTRLLLGLAPGGGAGGEHD